DGEAAGLGGTDRRHGAIKYALLRYRLIVVLFEPIKMHGEEQVRRWFELVELLLQKKGVGAQRDKFLTRHDAFDDGPNILMDQRFAAWDCHHWGAALVHRSEALLDRKPSIEDRIGIIDLATTGAREVAPEQRLEHDHQRIALAAKQPLLEQVD